MTTAVCNVTMSPVHTTQVIEPHLHTANRFCTRYHGDLTPPLCTMLGLTDTVTPPPTSSSPPPILRGAHCVRYRNLSTPHDAATNSECQYMTVQIKFKKKKKVRLKTHSALLPTRGGLYRKNGHPMNATQRVMAANRGLIYFLIYRSPQISIDS